jgi:gamma-glutamyl phosphate reductase
MPVRIGTALAVLAARQHDDGRRIGLGDEIGIDRETAHGRRKVGVKSV